MSLDFPAFELTEEHRELRAVVRALADDKIAPRAAEVDESGEFPWDVHDALAKAELTGVHIPEARRHGSRAAEVAQLGAGTFLTAPQHWLSRPWRCCREGANAHSGHEPAILG